MRLHAWIAPELAAAWRADPFLAGFDWCFCLPGELPPPGPLTLAIADDLERLPADWAAAPRCETWLFSSAVRPWTVSPDIACFSGAPDCERLTDRLMAWYWVRGLALPAEFSGCQLELMNGLASVRVGAGHDRHEEEQCTYGMHVISYGACGGDLALRLSSHDRDVFILADALGKGEKAAQDVAIFAEGAVARLKQRRLSDELVRELAIYMCERLPFPRFVAAIVIEFDWKHNSACLLNAGMPALLASTGDAPIREYASDGAPFGVPSILATCREVTLPEAAVWLMTSDGVEEGIRQNSLATLAANSDQHMASLISPSFHLAFSWNTVRPPAGMDDASLILIQTKSPGR